MLGMNQRERRIFRLALLGHILLVFCLFIFSFIPSCEKEPEVVHVFELASSPPPPPPTPQIRTTPPKPSPKPVIQKPAPKPTPPKPKPVVKKTIPKPTPKPIINQAPPKKISFDQFRKQHDLPSPQPKVNQPPVKQVKIKINPNDFKLAPIVLNTPSQSTSSVSPTIINQYLAGVKSRLEQVWQHLLAQTDLSSGGIAHLGFRIGSDGALIQPRITKSSGNSVLDALVLRVAQSAGNVGRPPGGSFSSSLEIPFRVN